MHILTASMALANANCLLFLSAFCQPYKFTTGEMVPMEGSKSAVRPNIVFTVSTCLSRPCSGILSHCGYKWMS